MTEKAVDKELLSLMKRSNQTTAEKAFYSWLLQWKNKLAAARAATGGN